MRCSNTCFTSESSADSPLPLLLTYFAKDLHGFSIDPQSSMQYFALKYLHISDEDICEFINTEHKVRITELMISTQHF